MALVDADIRIVEESNVEAIKRIFWALLNHVVADVELPVVASQKVENSEQQRVSY